MTREEFMAQVREETRLEMRRAIRNVLRTVRARINRGQGVDEVLYRTIYDYNDD